MNGDKRKQGQYMHTVHPISFSGSDKKELFSRYLRATYGQEVRVMNLAGCVLIIVALVALALSIIFPSEKIPDLIQTWREIRFYAIVPLIFTVLLLCARNILLFAFDSEKAWKSKRLGQKFIESGEKYGPMPKDDYKYHKEHDHYKYAYYFDVRLGCKDRVPTEAELYCEKLVVKKPGRKKDEVILLEDAYKEFWGAGILTLRFKTEYGPKDVVLSVQGWSEEKRDHLAVFLTEALAPWCRKYTRRPQFPLSRRRRAFLFHPIYDRWDYKIPLVHRKAQIVDFKTPSELFDCRPKRMDQ